MTARRLSPRRTRTLLLSLAVALTASSAPPAMAAGAAAEVLNERSRTVSVTAGTRSEDDCAITEEGIYADAGHVFYSAGFFDGCTNEGASVIATAVPILFQVAPNRKSVRVVAELHLEDPFTDELTGEVLLIDNTWRATGRGTRTVSSVRSTVPSESNSSSRVVESSRPASVTGTLPLPGGEISVVSERSLVVSRTGR